MDQPKLPKDADLFTNRPPNEAQGFMLDSITEAMLGVDTVLRLLPDSRFKSLARTKLEECSMWAKKATVFTYEVDAPLERTQEFDSHEDFRAYAERAQKVVFEATGVEGHAIRCGHAIIEAPMGAPAWRRQECDMLIGQLFPWYFWGNPGAIVAAEPVGDHGVKVDVWAVPN